jgi:hypothetical protein
LAHALAQVSGRAGKGRDLSKYDFAVGNTVLGKDGPGSEAGKKDDCNSKLIAVHRLFLELRAYASVRAFFVFRTELAFDILDAS